MESSEGREGMATRSQLSVLGLPKAERMAATGRVAFAFERCDMM